MFELTEQLAKELSSKIAKFDIKELWENGSFKVVASDETIDRAGEVIKVSWWELDNFMKNPVIIANHVYKVENIIWKATNVYTEDYKLVVEWVFATTDLAQDVRKLYDWGFIKTVSVGFIPLDRDPNQPNIITRAELLEVSFVPVPCNPNALSLGKEVVDDLVAKGLLIKEEEVNEQETEENVNENETWAENEEIATWEEENVANNEENDNNENEEGNVEDVKQLLKEAKALLSEIKDLISNNNIWKEDDNSGNLEEKDAKIKMQKETLQSVSKLVSECLHNIKL